MGVLTVEIQGTTKIETGEKTAENVYSIQASKLATSSVPNASGQRVNVDVENPAKP